MHPWGRASGDGSYYIYLYSMCTHRESCTRLLPAGMLSFHYRVVADVSCGLCLLAPHQSSCGPRSCSSILQRKCHHPHHIPCTGAPNLGGNLPTRQAKTRSNSTTKPVASHCSANKRKQRHSFNHSFCTPSPKPVPLQPRGLSKHTVSPFSSLFNKVSFNLSIAAMSNMTLPRGVGGRAVAAPCAAAECPSCQYQCRIAHSYMPVGGRPRVGLWFLRSGIDILMLVRDWHGCLQRPLWLGGREHKCPTVALSLLTSVTSAFPSVFQKCWLSR